MSVLDHLSDYRVVSVTLPLQGEDTVKLDAVAKATSGSFVEVTFLQGQLEAQPVNMEGICRLGFDVGGENKAIKAKIAKRSASSRLIVEMVETFTYQQKRSYFRIDADLSVNYWLIDKEAEPSPNSVRSLVNLSGGGVRFPVKEKLPLGKRIGLELVLDSSEAAVIECEGEVVGNYNQGRQILTALKFVKIEEDDRDLIVAHCLAEQRKQLRMKVQVLAGMN